MVRRRPTGSAMRTTLIAGLATALCGFGLGGAAAQDSIPATVLFGRFTAPADLQSRSIGFYSRGCLAGAVDLPITGPDWQVMRLSRNRNWGMPVLVDYLETLANDAKVLDGWPGLLIGDMSQPRGGPMATGHASHQIGLDVDVWLDPMPDHTLSDAERESIGATSYIVPGTHTELDKALWTDAQARLIHRAASYDQVERIFVNPGIKKQLCETAGTDRAWLRKIRPWYLHDDHFHVRLYCPPGMADCKPQDPPPAGDGCGADLAWWLSPVPYLPAPKPAKPPPPLTLAGLPKACRDVVSAPAPGSIGAEVNIPLPQARPTIN